MDGSISDDWVDRIVLPDGIAMPNLQLQGYFRFSRALIAQFEVSFPNKIEIGSRSGREGSECE